MEINEHEQTKHAQSTDDARRYQNNQNIWLEQSRRIVKEMAQKLTSGKLTYFSEVFAELAEERYLLAVKVNGTAVSNTGALYGQFCQDNRRNYEAIYYDAQEQQWHTGYQSQREEIFKQLDYIVHHRDQFQHLEVIVETVEQDETSETFSDNKAKKVTLCYQRPDFPRDFKVTAAMSEKIISLINKAPGNYAILDLLENDLAQRIDEDCNPFSTVEVHYNAQDKIEVVVVSYARTFKYNLTRDYVIAESLFATMRAWQPSDGLSVFKQHAGRLAYYLAHCLFIQRGTAAVAEWLIKSVGLSKGIQLGEIGQFEKIGWAWKALVTPTIDTYADWFAENTFNDAVYQPVGTAKLMQKHSMIQNLASDAPQKEESWAVHNIILN